MFMQPYRQYLWQFNENVTQRVVIVNFNGAKYGLT
jgi:hypothetical protein